MADRSAVHVHPVNDLVEHVTDGGDCPCGPTTEPVSREDGSMGWLVVHHSLDGRELREPGGGDVADLPYDRGGVIPGGPIRIEVQPDECVVAATDLRCVRADHHDRPCHRQPDTDPQSLE